MEDAQFEGVWSKYSRAIISYCAYSTGSKSDGEDIAADVFVQLLKSRRPVAPDRVEAWLFAVARNLCANHHRAAARRQGLFARLDSTPDVSPSDRTWPDSELWDAVRRLDERSRMVVYLRVFEQRPFADIARMLGVSTSAVKMTYYRAMDRVRARLSSADATGAGPAIGGVENAE